MKTEELISLIERSFPKLSSESDSYLPADLTEEDLEVYRDDLNKFYVEDLPPYLGAVLYDAASKKKAEGIDGWSIDMLVYFLNAWTEKPSSEEAFSDLSNEEIKGLLDARAKKQNDFVQLPLVQIEAILAWLKSASDWPELCMLSGEIDDAVRCWERILEQRKRN